MTLAGWVNPGIEQRTLQIKDLTEKLEAALAEVERLKDSVEFEKQIVEETVQESRRDCEFFSNKAEKLEAEVERLKAELTTQETTMDSYDRSIHSNPDASAWAKFYCETFPGSDEELMIGWFANAMMAMYDYHIKQADMDAAVDKIDTASTHTWEAERAAVVKWMGEMIANYLMVEHSECWPEDMIEEIKKDIERGEHWPKDGE